MKWLPYLIFAALISFLPTCDSERATQEQCRAIFDRLVQLEVREMGFNDPVLTVRRQAEFAARYANEIRACVGRPIPPAALKCVLSAETAEAVSHECLR